MSLDVTKVSGEKAAPQQCEEEVKTLRSLETSEIVDMQ